MALSIYHVIVSADAEGLIYGACALTATDATRLVQRRAETDGYKSIRHISTKRVCVNPARESARWEAGNVLCYGGAPLIA